MKKITKLTINIETGCGLGTLYEYHDSNKDLLNRVADLEQKIYDTNNLACISSLVLQYASGKTYTKRYKIVLENIR